MVSLLIGTGWLGIVIGSPLYGFVSGGMDGPHPLFLLTMVPLLAIPGGILLWFGWKLFRSKSEEALRWIMGTGSFLLICFACTRIGEIFSLQGQDSIWDGVVGLISTFVIALAYPVLISRISPIIGAPRKSPSEFVSKSFLGLLAFSLFGSLSSLKYALGFRPDFDSTKSYFMLLPPLLEMAYAFSPMLVPYLAYRIAVKCFPAAQK